MSKLLQRLQRSSQIMAWVLLILMLPLTSLPALARWAGANTVAAPSAIPLLWLVLVWFIPFSVRNGTVPRQAIPLIVFVSAAILTSAGAFFNYIPPFKARSPLLETRDALLTLAVGAAFYLILASWPRSPQRLRFTLQLLNLGGLLLVAWSLMQAYFIWSNGGRYPAVVVDIQRWLSLRSLFPNRVTGLAFEPSWLAHQLNILYLPYWLAASLCRHSAHRMRLFGLTLENALLGGGVAVLFFSFSRIGVLAFLLVVSYLIVRGTLRLIRRLNARVNARLSLPAGLRGVIRLGASVVLLATFSLVYVAGAVGIVYSISRYDDRLAALFDLETLQSGNLYIIANDLVFAERIIYWATGWEVFNEHPFLGVGLGNAGFYFPERMPAFGWGLWEVNQIFTRLSFLPNIKSLWARLLAETGLLGFSIFLTWLYVLWRSAEAVGNQPNRQLRSVVLAGQLTLVAFLIEGFSVDSFALPYLWVSLGILTAALDMFQLHSTQDPARLQARKAGRDYG